MKSRQTGACIMGDGLESTGIILLFTRDGLESTGYLRLAESPCAEKENVPVWRGKGLCEGWRGEGTNASLISSVYESVTVERRDQ